MESYIELVGEDAAKKAKFVADYFETAVVNDTQVICTPYMENKICMSEDDLEETCDELTMASSLRFLPDDFQF